jgi:hypothetical protein
MTGTLDPRTRAHIQMDAETGCWLWTGTVGRYGYGNSGRQDSHRLVYERLVGPVPAGLQLDHLCRVRRCVNPGHLEPVTRLENVRRSPHCPGNRATCVHGHPYTETNTRLVRMPHLTNPIRVCKTCVSAASRRAYLKRLAGVK